MDGESDDKSNLCSCARQVRYSSYWYPITFVVMTATTAYYLRLFCSLDVGFSRRFLFAPLESRVIDETTRRFGGFEYIVHHVPSA